MATCPDGHQSASEDYCDVCGMLISGAPAAGSSSAPAGPPAASPSGGDRPAGTSAGACPVCNAPRSGVFCESCGYNFSTGAPAFAGVPPTTAVPPAPAAPPTSVAPPTTAAGPPATSTLPDASAASVATPSPDPAASSFPVASSFPAASAVGTPTGWTAVVAADHAYYENVEAASGPDGSGIDFPAYCPERRFQLTGTEMRIGRRSPSRGIEPEIDLTGPPTDPGISRLHAVLIATPDGWAVIDPGSANGTQLNGADIPTGMQLPLHDGDRINLGAWTTITVHGAG
jgi:hypothetical protein